MELSKETIENVQFTTVERKYYVATEVDEFLDELANLVQQNNLHIQSLNQKITYFQQVIDAVQDEAKQEKELQQQATFNQMLATSRSLYYNALQFQAQITAQFDQLQQDTTQAINLLQPATTIDPFPLRHQSFTKKRSDKG